MLFVTGIMLGMGVVTETGVWGDVAQWFDMYIHPSKSMFSGIVIFNIRSFSPCSPNLDRVRIRFRIVTITANSAAIPRYPMPVARPVAMARKIGQG